MMNIYNLLDDPAVYFQYTAFAIVLMNLPVSLFIEKAFTVSRGG